MSRCDDDWLYELPPWGFGSAHSVSDIEPDHDPVAELHKIVEEVTGKPVETPSRRIGFY